MDKLNLISAKELPIELMQGDTVPFTMEFFDEEQTPYPLDLEFAKWNIRNKAQETVCTLAYPGEGILIENNVLTVEDLSRLPRGNYHYDLKLKFSTGQIFTYLTGIIHVH